MPLTNGEQISQMLLNQIVKQCIEIHEKKRDLNVYFNWGIQYNETWSGNGRMVGSLFECSDSLLKYLYIYKLI